MNPVESRVSVGILITGNEVLFGKTRDTNGPHMASALRKVGCDVRRSLVCGDDTAEILRALSYLFETCDVVLMTGGLGPTSDDLTAEIIAQWFDVPVEFNEEAWQACVEAFTRMGRTSVPETNRKQARLPRGCKLIANPVGTAVGFRASGNHKGREIAVYALPGVPFEMEPMFATSVLPDLGVPGAMTLQRTWQVFGLGESAMQERVSALEARIKSEIPSAIVSYQAHAGYVTYACFVAARDHAESKDVESMLDGFVSAGVAEAFGHHVVSRAEGPLCASVVDTLISAGVTLAVAESCTGGALSKEITSVPRSSSCYVGGMTTYANDWKERFLGVPSEVLAGHGAVSEETAAAMALGLQARAGVDLTISITGVAGPGGGTERAPVGTVCLGLAFRTARIPREALAPLLAKFKWQVAPGQNALSPFGGEGEVAVLTTTVRFGSRMRRDVIQMRATVFALGTLAVAASTARAAS